MCRYRTRYLKPTVRITGIPASNFGIGQLDIPPIKRDTVAVRSLSPRKVGELRGSVLLPVFPTVGLKPVAEGKQELHRAEVRVGSHQDRVVGLRTTGSGSHSVRQHGRHARNQSQARCVGRTGCRRITALAPERSPGPFRTSRRLAAAEKHETGPEQPRDAPVTALGTTARWQPCASRLGERVVKEQNHCGKRKPTSGIWYNGRTAKHVGQTARWCPTFEQRALPWHLNGTWSCGWRRF